MESEENWTLKEEKVLSRFDKMEDITILEDGRVQLNHYLLKPKEDSNGEQEYLTLES